MRKNCALTRFVRARYFRATPRQGPLLPPAAPPRAAAVDETAPASAAAGAETAAVVKTRYMAGAGAATATETPSAAEANTATVADAAAGTETAVGTGSFTRGRGSSCVTSTRYLCSFGVPPQALSRMFGGRKFPSVEDNEQARAFLQVRLALFWKVICLIMVFASVLGTFGGGLKRVGSDLVIDVGLAALAGAFWWLCARGARTLRFLRTLEVAALLVYFTGASFLGRFVLIGFARERGLTTAEGALMADAYLSILGMVGAAMMITVRAALIPSSPRRTIAYTAMVGVPAIVTPSLLAPNSQGGFTLRALDSIAFPWLPAALVVVWSIVIITCTVISWVIYGLRVQVREARRLGQYVIEQKIGEGGMGQVYRARHGMMRRPTALKLLHPDRTSQADLVRFEREVQLTARLTHPNTITIFDYGRTDDGVFYYAMELLDGANLQHIVEVSGPQPEGRVVRILTMACGALAEAHARGLIHRDLKPANIVLCSRGGELDVVKVLDFGLVKELALEGDAHVTAAAAIVGTPLYMAPECIVDPTTIDARADIYALGAVAYYLLTGTEVFGGKTVIEVCAQHLHREPDTMAGRGVTVSPALEAIVRACLEKKPGNRPQSTLEFRQRLLECDVVWWSDEQARTWWGEHQPALERGAAISVNRSRTVEIDAHSRTPIEATG